MAHSDAVDLLVSPLAHERAARARDHRPWSAPARSWVMAESCTDLLFEHWTVAREALQRAVLKLSPRSTYARTSASAESQASSFLSIHAGGALADAAARAVYRLPYFNAHMTIGREADTLRSFWTLEPAMAAG